MTRPSLRRPFLRRLVAIATVLAAGGCSPDRHPTGPEATPALSAATQPRLASVVQTEAATPRYPAAVLYILYREYVNKHPRVRTLRPEDRHYQQYVERRLRRLYPGKGYDGMLADAVAEVKRDREKWAAAHGTATYEGPVDEVPCTADNPCGGSGGTGETPPAPGDELADPSWSGVEEHAAPPEGYVPTLQEEVDTLQAEPVEVERILYYESLAAGSYQPPVDNEVVVPYAAGPQPRTTDDYIRLAGQGWTPMDGGTRRPQALGTALVALPVVAGLAGYLYWRIETAGNRAERRAIQFYPAMNQYDTQADAFRHIFLSMQLRRYCTGWLAKKITDRHEQNGTNSDGARVMDLHNNDVGRDTRYKHFRGHWLWDRWDWKEWSTRVRSYVNNPANAEFIPQWKENPPPPLEAIQAREGLTPNWKYIYIFNG